MIFMFSNAQKAFAKQEIIEASGNYIMDPRLDEVPATSMARAREEAKRNAIEKAGTYIQSYSKMVDFSLEYDEVRAVAAQLLKIIEEKSSISVIHDNLLEFTIHIKALVDDNNGEMLKNIMADKQKLEEMTERNNELQKEYDKLKSQIEELKRQYNFANDDKKDELKKVVAQNDKHFNAAQELEKGNEFYLLGNYTAALECYTKAINLNNTSSESYNNRGLSYYHLNKISESIEDFNRAIDLNDSFVYAYNNRGISHQSAGNFELAIRDYTRALQINPQYFNALNNRANTYAAIKKYQDAINDFKFALKLVPNNAKIHNNLGIVYNSLGQYENARNEYTKAISLEPNYAEAYYNRGIIYFRQGRYADAVVDARKAVELNPNDPNFHDLLKRINTKLNR